MKKKEMNKDEVNGGLNINSTIYTTRLSKKFLNRKPYQPADPKLIVSHIPGTIIGILVKEGDVIKTGDDLLILDSMKMKNRIKSSRDGVIEKVEVKVGDKVSKGAVLARFK